MWRAAGGAVRAVRRMTAPTLPTNALSAAHSAVATARSAAPPLSSAVPIAAQAQSRDAGRGVAPLERTTSQRAVAAAKTFAVASGPSLGESIHTVGSSHRDGGVAEKPAAPEHKSISVSRKTKKPSAAPAIKVASIHWPPPGEALKKFPELLQWVKDREAKATPKPEVPSAEVILGSLQRLSKLASDKLPHTHMPSIAKSTLALVKMASLRNELETLGLNSKGRKPVIIRRLLEFFESAQPPVASSEKLDGRRRGMKVELSPSQIVDLQASETPHPGSFQAAVAAPKKLMKKRAMLNDFQSAHGNDAEKAIRERRQYERLFAPEEVVQMLLKAHARNVVLIPVTESCSWTEAMIVAEGQSLNHLEALAGAVYFQIRERLRAKVSNGEVAEGVLPKVEGLQYESPEWLLLDAGSVVIHIFTQRARLEYNLEELWGNEGSNVIRFGQEPVLPEPITLEENPSLKGEIAVGSLIRGAGLPTEEVFIFNKQGRQRLAGIQCGQLQSGPRKGVKGVELPPAGPLTEWPGMGWAAGGGEQRLQPPAEVVQAHLSTLQREMH